MKFGLATPLQYHARNKEANLILQSHGIGVHHIPGPLVVKCMYKTPVLGSNQRTHPIIQQLAS